MRYRQVVMLLVFLVVAAVSVGAGGVAASAQPAVDEAVERSGSSKQANRGKGKKKPSCRRFCSQAGGFGDDCEEETPEDCNDVDVPSQKLDGTGDQVVSIRATCKLETDCVGAIILTSYKGQFGSADFPGEYGRADLEIPAGETKKVKVGISKAGLEYLKKHGKDKSAFVTVPLDTEPLSVSVSTDTITVLPPG